MINRILSFRALLIAAIVVLLYAGCSQHGGTSGYKDSQANSETAISTRAQARWDALIAGDWNAVYQFSTPAYRATYSIDYFNNQYANQVKRKKAEVAKVSISSADPAAAKVVLNVLIETPGFDGSPPMEIQVWQHENWVKRDGNWWYVEPR